MIIITITIILIILIIFMSILLYHAMKKINQYESFIVQFSQIVNFATEKMKQVDNTGHYEADDETSFFFQQLKQIQIMMNDLFESPEEIKDATKKEK